MKSCDLTSGCAVSQVVISEISTGLKPLGWCRPMRRVETTGLEATEAQLAFRRAWLGEETAPAT